MSEKLFHSHESFMYTYAKKAVLIISKVMNFVEYVIINIDQLESRDRTSVRKIAAQNNKGCGCFLYKQEPENTKSQLPVFVLMNMV